MKWPDFSNRLWVEEGDPQLGLIAEVAPVAYTGRTYSFAVAETLATALSIGQRVRVPLGRGGRLVVGFVVQLSRGPWDNTLRTIDSVVDPAAYLTPELIELGRQIAEHYCCRLGLVLKAMTPEAVRKERGLKTVRYVRLIRSVGEVLSSEAKLSPKRRAIIEMLAASAQPPRIDILLQQCGASPAIVRALARDGIIEITKRKEIEEREDTEAPIVEPTFDLTDEQTYALHEIGRRIEERRFSTTLLFGVSGSGKTEVYIRAIRQVLAEGRQAILLVPEIMLTTQLVSRIISRLPRVAVSHSGLSDAQRSIIWRQTASGEKRVVIGTRSAVFAPCPRLGLLCVDEEQETSYKNLQAPRFHVRDVAIMRAKQLGVPVVCGSATPSLEVWHNTLRRKDYHRVHLRRRVKELPMPEVHIVDMRDETLEQRGPVLLSRTMVRLLSEALERREQALILMNRRGYANRVFCPACQARLACPNCSVGLVVHTASGLSICHYCRQRMSTPTVCPNVTCGSKLILVGAGTQKVEEAFQTRFPTARIRRVDSDTMKHRDQYQAVIDQFSAGAVDVLIGTQMIAKGLDFPGVTFVGVMDADAGGLAADFRAHERMFQLVTQTAGRAGRADAAGRVVVQTSTPELPALRFALKHDYEGFAAEELALRKETGLPPFRRLVRILFTHEREETVQVQAAELAQRIRTAIEGLQLPLVDVLGPNACILPRLRGQYRYDLLLRSPDASTLRRLLHQLTEARALRIKQGTLIVDVDPVSLT